MVMSWRQLVEIIRESTAEAQAGEFDPPQACPNDGEPLVRDASGELRCGFDGWTPSGGTPDDT
jgi:hypothetical protein